MTASINDGPAKDGVKNVKSKITTMIFDVDDTLYDVGNGFTAMRNTDCVTDFMVEKLHFPSKEAAQKLRDEYFFKYHATAKGLTAAEEDGRLPPLPEGVTLPPGRDKIFDPAELDQYWATNLDFSLLGGPDPELIKTFELMSTNPNWNLNLVAFSNGPRKYVLRALKEMGLDSFFTPDKVFAVTDVLPNCKPDKASFEFVLKSIGANFEECVMVEDSMKNVRAAKALGMQTILVAGKGSLQASSAEEKAKRAEATGTEDVPDETDPAVDGVVEVASEIGDVLTKWLGP